MHLMADLLARERQRTLTDQARQHRLGRHARRACPPGRKRPVWPLLVGVLVTCAVLGGAVVAMS